MALKDTTIIWKVNICFQVTAFIISLVGFGSNYLVYFKSGAIESHAGLWEICTQDTCLDTADSLKVVKLDYDWVAPSKAMMALSIVIYFLTILATVGSAFLNSAKMTIWIIAAAELLAALCGVVGVSVAVGNVKDIMEDETKVTFAIGWSFIVFLVAKFADIATGLLLLLDARLKLGAATNTWSGMAGPANISTIYPPSYGRPPHV